MRRIWFVLILALGLGLSACTTVPDGKDAPITQYPDPDVENPGVIIIAQPLDVPPAPPVIPAPPSPPKEAPPEPVYEIPTGFERLVGWTSADHRPAFHAFQRSCESWAKADPNKKLNPNLPEYGRFKDWMPACAEAKTLPQDNLILRSFFERHFAPVSLSDQKGQEGLLTGYYEPEINVRILPDAIYSEPILAKPTNKAVLKLPRSKINARSSRVIAYGRPIDVFFMQVQGSGRIRYANGRSVRAAYSGNNGKTYKSIGRVLVQRGEMTVEQASKQAIEKWMEENGPAASRELMNQNPRYIFFAEQAILAGEGPRGSMRVPLTTMGSIAIDRRYHPLGTLAWLETTLPQYGGDYRGVKQSVLVVAQDTGNAIKGPLRGDLFFGSGDLAGDKAGVMKHPVRWTLLLPKSIAPRPAGVS